MSRRLLFHRRYLGYTGGHAKVADYFRHALAAGWDARIHFTADSTLDGNHPWVGVGDRVEQDWRPERADALFLAGTDWAAVPAGLEERLPVFNLIQGFGHFDPKDSRFRYLQRRATRIAVGRPLFEALEGSSANGPLKLSVNGIAPRLRGIRKTERITVLGGKRADLAPAVVDRLRALGADATHVDRAIAPAAFAELLAASVVVVALPCEVEGFYLPALEAMASRAAVVTLDALGNREYLVPEGNALVVDAESASIAKAAMVLDHDAALRGRLVEHGTATASTYTLEAECERFNTLLDSLP